MFTLLVRGITINLEDRSITVSPVTNLYTANYRMVKQRVQIRYFKWVHKGIFKKNNKQELEMRNKKERPLQCDSISQG